MGIIPALILAAVVVLAALVAVATLTLTLVVLALVALLTTTMIVLRRLQVAHDRADRGRPKVVRPVEMGDWV